MNKFRFSVFGILTIISFSCAPLFAASVEPNDQKAMFKISDTEINMFLDKTKTSSPGLYNTLMQLKNTDGKQSEATICGLIAQERLKNSNGLMEQSRRAQIDQMRIMYNISDKDINAYLVGLNRANATEYNSLMGLKASNFSAYEMTLLGKVLNYRRTGSYSLSRDGAAGSPIDELTKVSAEISQKSTEIRGMKNPAAKQKAVLELKALMGKSYDLSTELLTVQAAKAEEQVRAVQRMIGVRSKDKSKSIDAWLTQIIGE